MAECKETRELCRIIEARPNNGMTYPLVAGTHVPPGWPDRFLAFCVGKMEFSGHVEFKVGTRKVTKLQERIIRDLLARGHFACACWIVEAAPNWKFRIREYLPNDVEMDQVVDRVSGLMFALAVTQQQTMACWRAVR